MTRADAYPSQLFEVREPRWRDRSVLLADYKIGSHNEVIFTGAPSLPGAYYVAGTVAKGYPLHTMSTRAGKSIALRVVPLDALEPLE